jgi:hypothetical protein
MSALGHKQTFAAISHVRFIPESGRRNFAECSCGILNLERAARSLRRVALKSRSTNRYGSF